MLSISLVLNIWLILQNKKEKERADIATLFLTIIAVENKLDSYASYIGNPGLFEWAWNDPALPKILSNKTIDIIAGITETINIAESDQVTIPTDVKGNLIMMRDIVENKYFPATLEPTTKENQKKIIDFYRSIKFYFDVGGPSNSWSKFEERIDNFLKSESNKY